MLKQRPQSAGRPSKIVTNEYLRHMNDVKTSLKVGRQSTQDGRGSPTAGFIARSRFDNLEPPSPEKAELAKIVEKVGHTDPNTLMFVDKNKDR